MKNFKFFIFSILLISNFNIKSVDWLITTSGNYKLGYDINSTGDANGTIRVQSSYVNLDLNGFFLRQTTSTSGCIGIVIDPGCNNINIKNGIVTGFKRTGISVGANCSRITIKDILVNFCTASGASGAGIAVGAGCNNLLLDNILTYSCTVDGIDFNGTSNNNIVDSVIRNCCVIGCSTDAANGILLSNCARIKMSNSIINSNGNSSNDFTGINLNSSTSCSLENMDMKNNRAGDFFIGISINNSSQSILKNCVMDGDNANTVFTGCVVSGSNNCTLEGFKILNTISSAVFTGINIISANALNLSKISIEGNVLSGGNTYFIQCSDVSNSIFDDLQFLNNSSSGAGIQMIRCVTPFFSNKISNFVFGGNSGSSSNSIGIIFVAGGVTNFSNNNISNGLIENNSNSGGTSVIGISMDPYTTGNYFSNIIIQGNSSAGSGFQGISQTSNTASSNNYFYECKVLNNSCASSASITPAAFLFSTPVNLQLIRCIAANNRCSGAVCYGLNIATTGSSSGNVIRDCEFYENNGNTDANSYGVSCGDSASTLFINNVSYKNGPTNPLIANQLFGLPIGSTTTPGGGGAGMASPRIASATAPWTNLQITN